MIAAEAAITGMLEWLATLRLVSLPLVERFPCIQRLTSSWSDVGCEKKDAARKSSAEGQIRGGIGPPRLEWTDATGRRGPKSGVLMFGGCFLYRPYVCEERFADFTFDRIKRRGCVEQ
jgi:hypothetical protein